MPEINKINKKSKKKLFKFHKDLSWKREVIEYINCIKLNKKIHNGTIYDSMKVMKMIDNIYKSDKSWRNFFFNGR